MFQKSKETFNGNGSFKNIRIQDDKKKKVLNLYAVNVIVIS